MDARDIILRPIVTEQSMSEMDNRKYTFEVAINAEKTAVRRAVEEIFDVILSGSPASAARPS